MLNYSELYTVLTEIESVINARPLTYIYDDTEGISYPLTPSQLVNGRNLQQNSKCGCLGGLESVKPLDISCKTEKQHENFVKPKIMQHSIAASSVPFNFSKIYQIDLVLLTAELPWS